MDYELFLPSTPVFENDDFVVYADPLLIPFAKDMMNYLLGTKKEVLDFFGLNDFRKIHINLYDTRKNFTQFTSQFFTPPNVSKWNFCGGMLNIFVSSQVLKNDDMYDDRIKIASHGCIHIIYGERVQEQGKNKRVAWLDEGLAMFLSGQNHKFILDDEFKRYFLTYIMGAGKEIPSIEFLKKHNDNLEYGAFVDSQTYKYNGYYLSYVIIRYLNETMPKEDFQKLIREKVLIEELEKTVLDKAIDYYLNKFNLSITCNIDRTNLDTLLVNSNQNAIGTALQQAILEIGDITTLDDIARLWVYIRSYFNMDKDNQFEKFVRTSEEIATSKIWSGCSDMGTLVAPILRANGIPTVYLQSARLDWINDVLNNDNKKTSVRGHIFLELCLNDEWILFDSTNGYFYRNYDYNNKSLPNNYYAFSKSLNGHEVGFNNLANNNDIMTQLFADFYIENYINPHYEKIDIRDGFDDMTTKKTL